MRTERFYRNKGSERKKIHHRVKRPGSFHSFIPKADRSLCKIFSEIGIPQNNRFIPDDFQLEAIENVKHNDVLVSAPTGSGKTWIAVQAIKSVLSEGKRAWYASPLKALSNSKFHEFIEEFGAERVGVLTGDRKENTDAPVIVGTTEILRNQLYDAMSQSADFTADLVVLDEAHYLGDAERGVVWEEVMIYLPRRVRLLLLSATIQNDVEIASWLESIRHHPCQVVHSEKRPVPIHPLYLLPSGEIVQLSGSSGINTKIKHLLNRSEKHRFRRLLPTIAYEHILQILEEFNLLPAIFFLKSRFECNTALAACRNRIIPGERTRIIQSKINELLQEYPFLAQHPHLHHTLFNALGSHHGGQLPHWKIVIEKLMNAGYLDAIFSTTTVAAGVNFPARTVVLVQSDRFNGKEFVSLSATDLHQATGRAGRRGKDIVGFAVMVHGPFQDPLLIDQLLANPPEPINSQIKMNFSMCLNLLVSHKPEEINNLLDASFAHYQNMKPLHELECNRNDVIEEFTHKMAGCSCSSYTEVLQRIEQRTAGLQKLVRLKKRLKKNTKRFFSEQKRLLKSLEKKTCALEQELKDSPCSSCSHCELCHEGTPNHFLKLAQKAQWLTQVYEQARSKLWQDFCRHFDFLVLNGFAEHDGRLTADGLWAAQLRLDQPLVIAELIRRGLFARLTPQLLAGIVAVFVNDKFRDIDINPAVSWDKHSVLRDYYRMKNAVKDIIALKKKYRFDVPQIQFWPAAALYLWATGENWETVIRIASVDEGDLAMLIFRTADNLRQITSLKETHPALAHKARYCIDLLLREPVVIPT